MGECKDVKQSSNKRKWGEEISRVKETKAQREISGSNRKRQKVRERGKVEKER